MSKREARKQGMWLPHSGCQEQGLGGTEGQSPGLQTLGLGHPAQQGQAEKDIFVQTWAWFCLRDFSDPFGEQSRREESLNSFRQVGGTLLTGASDAGRSVRKLIQARATPRVHTPLCT